MSLAFVLFGAPRYPPWEAFGDLWEHSGQHNNDFSADGYCDRHDHQWTDTASVRTKDHLLYPDEPSPKRRREDSKSSPQKTTPSLVPVPPSCPPPSYIFEAAKNRRCSAVGTHDPIVAEPSTIEYKVLRWMSWALRYGVNTHGIEVSNGWAHIHTLAKAASSDRNDFHGLTSGAFRTIIELDESGRWCIAGGRVCKVPRQARFPMLEVRSKPVDSNRHVDVPDDESSFY